MKTKTPLQIIGILFLLTIPALACLAQQQKRFTLSNFNEISVASGIDLYLNQGGSENIRVVANGDHLKNVIVEKNGSKLTIRYKNNNNWGLFRKDQSIKVYVSFKTLTSLSASGGSDVYSQNTIKAEGLDLHSSGGSDLKLMLIAKDVSIDVSGGSDVNLKGSATNLAVNSSGGSDLDALEFRVDNAKVNCSGGSDVTLHVSRALQADASGGSEISFKGNAALKNNPSKSGSVKRLR